MTQKPNESGQSREKIAREVMKELRAEGKRHMALRECGSDPILLAEVLPPIPGDPDRDVLIRKLAQGGITSRLQLTRYSPEGLAEVCGLDQGEVDALAQKCRFLRTREWLRRKRQARQRARRLTLRTRYFR